MSRKGASEQADDARITAEHLLAQAGAPSAANPDRLIAIAQVWATLAVSYELASRAP